MKSSALVKLVAFSLASTTVCISVYADEGKKKGADLSRAQGTVNSIREADTPQVQRSSGTVNAEEIARRENERERQRQAEESRRRQLDRQNVPPPAR